MIIRAPDDSYVNPATGEVHPQTPDTEIEFWRLRAGHLNDIWDQLQSNQVRAVDRVGLNSKFYLLNRRTMAIFTFN